VGEVPAELMHGYEAFPIDQQWQWVAVVDGRIVGQLLGANMHGLLFILRLTMLADAPPSCLLCLLRQAFRDAEAQGCMAYMTFLSDQQPAEVKLMRIVQRHNGYLESFSGAVAAGRLEVHN
jgi:hypothetical protein